MAEMYSQLLDDSSDQWPEIFILSLCLAVGVQGPRGVRSIHKPRVAWRLGGVQQSLKVWAFDGVGVHVPHKRKEKKKNKQTFLWKYGVNCIVGDYLWKAPIIRNGRGFLAFLRNEQAIGTFICYLFGLGPLSPHTFGFLCAAFLLFFFFSP